MEETAVRVVAKAVEERYLEKRDIVNFVSRLEGASSRGGTRSSNPNFGELWCSGLENELEKDPLFYAWEDYDYDDFIIKNQVLVSGWDAAVMKYPLIFKRLEEGVYLLKEATTFKTSKKFRYHLRANLELSSNDSLRIRTRIYSHNNHDLFHGLNFKFSKRGVEMAKDYSLDFLSNGASLDLGLNYFHGDYSARVTLKFPFWFGVRN